MTDAHAVHEIELYIPNDHATYRYHQVVNAAMARKLAKGTFDIVKAAKGYEYVVKFALKRYAVDLGTGIVLSKSDREQLALDLANEFLSEAQTNC